MSVIGVFRRCPVNKVTIRPLRACLSNGKTGLRANVPGMVKRSMSNVT